MMNTRSIGRFLQFDVDAVKQKDGVLMQGVIFKSCVHLLFSSRTVSLDIGYVWCRDTKALCSWTLKIKKVQDRKQMDFICNRRHFVSHPRNFLSSKNTQCGVRVRKRS